MKANAKHLANTVFNVQTSLLHTGYSWLQYNTELYFSGGVINLQVVTPQVEMKTSGGFKVKYFVILD